MTLACWEPALSLAFTLYMHVAQLAVGGFFKSKASAFIPDIEAGHRTAEAMEEAGEIATRAVDFAVPVGVHLQHNAVSLTLS